MREQIITNAVLSGLTVSGKFSSNEHNVCDLMNLSIESLDSLYRSNKELLDKQQTHSLLKKEKSTKVLEDKLQLLQTIFEFKVEQKEYQDKLKADKTAKQNRLILLSKAKERKEVEAISNLSVKELDKELAALS